MKQSVTIATDGRSVTAKIPAEIQAYRFLQYSELQLLRKLERWQNEDRKARKPLGVSS